ncbi:MAG: hypothetical protein JWO30_3379 [Fibrobacteres bacterium]|nr:hypothetical protein [Fibrobacterota bacterium]
MKTEINKKTVLEQIYSNANQAFVEFSVILIACRHFWKNRARFDSSEMKIFLIALTLGEKIYKETRGIGKNLRIKSRIREENVYAIANLSRPIFEASLLLNWMLYKSDGERAMFRKELYLLSGRYNVKLSSKRGEEDFNDIQKRFFQAINAETDQSIEVLVRDLKTNPHFKGLVRDHKKIIMGKKSVPPSLFPLKILKSKHSNSKKYADYEHLSFFAHVFSNELPRGPDDPLAAIYPLMSIHRLLGIVSRCLATSLSVIVNEQTFAGLLSKGSPGEFIRKHLDPIDFQ